MANDESKKQFDELVQGVADSLLSLIREEVGQRTWRLGYVDVRSPAQDGARIDKLRIEMEGGSIEGLHVPMDQRMLFFKIWAIKDKVFSKKWYGITITVYLDGHHEANYNYDPDCINDRAFYDVDEDE